MWGQRNRGVSEVIGVVLMVAITVVLAAVVATVVFEIGGDSDIAPTVSFDVDYDAAAGTVTVTHASGSTVRADEVHVRGRNLGSTGSWDALGGDASTTLEGVSAVSSGDALEVSADSDYVVRIVWESAAGETSAELAVDRGPDA